MSSAYLYFYYKEKSKIECIDVIEKDFSSIDIKCNNDALKGFIITPTNKNNILINVSCDMEYPYPLFTVKQNKNSIEFEIRSKYSCGETRQKARVLDFGKYNICVLMMSIGFYLVVYSETSFKKYEWIIIVLLFSLFLFFGVIGIFTYKISPIILITVFGICMVSSLILKVFTDAYKYINHAVIAYLAVNLGLNFGYTICPRAKIYQQVI